MNSRRKIPHCGGEKEMWDEKRLCDARVGEVCRITEINVASQAGKRLADLGASRGAVIRCVGESPFGDPRAYLLLGGVFAIRNRDAALIEVACDRKGVLYARKKRNKREGRSRRDE